MFVCYILYLIINSIFSQNVIGEDVVPAVCALAKKLDINEVRISGNKEYAMGFVEDIKSTYALTYNSNNINVEVI
jgi:hypothetical protein